MQKLIFILILGVVFQTNAQVPSKVITTFKTRYPKVKDEKWSIVEEKYHANFEHIEQSKTAVYNPDGTWIHTIVMMDLRELMFCIRDYINETHVGFKAIKADLIRSPNSTMRYQVVIQYDNLDSLNTNGKPETITLLFTENCQVLPSN